VRKDLGRELNNRQSSPYYEREIPEAELIQTDEEGEEWSLLDAAETTEPAPEDNLDANEIWEIVEENFPVNTTERELIEERVGNKTINLSPSERDQARKSIQRFLRKELHYGG